MTTYTKETALYDTGAIAGDIAEAGTTASDYITAVTNDGIWVHPEGAGPVNGQPTASTSGWHISDAIELFRQGVSFIKMWVENSVAKLRLGRGNESHVEIDFHSLKLIDKEGSTYFHVSDLRDADGLATIVEKSISDGTTRSIETRLWIYEVISVKVNGTDVEYTASARVVTLQNTPLPDSEIVITYKTEDASAKAYTLGDRQDGEPIGPCSIVEGRYCVASGDTAYAEGYGNAANGDNSHAEGANTTASGRTAHSEGNYSVASGIASHAEGRQTEATKSYAHAEGWGTDATETCAHAEGRDTTASGMYSHAEGYKTQATATNAHAEGSGSVASGISSHAQNSYTTAAANYQTTIGKYNVADTVDASGNGAYALIVGNGTANNARSNALTVDWNGNVVAAGGLDLGTSLAIADGGTGATTAQGARTNLGVPALAASTNTYAGSQILEVASADTTKADNDVTANTYRIFGSKDSNDHYITFTQTCVYAAGSVAVELASRNYGTGSGVTNLLRLTINNDGSREVYVTEQAPWWAGLGLNTWTTVALSDFATAASGWAFSTSNCNVQYNAALKALRVRIQIAPSAAQTAGQKTMFTVKTAYRPKTFAASLSSLTAYAQAGQIYTSGGFAVNITAISANTNLYFNGVYFIGA